MTSSDEASRSVSHEDEDQRIIRRAVETSIRIAVVLLVAYLCYRAFHPFLFPALWGAMIAVAIRPTHVRLAALLGGRTTWAAVLLAALILATLMVPAAFLVESLATGVYRVIDDFRHGTLVIPPPPDVIKTWPFIGARVHEVWLLGSHDPRAALQEVAPLLDDLGKWLLAIVRGTGSAVVQFTLATVMAAFMLAGTKTATKVLTLVAVKLSPVNGASFVVLAERTVRSVAVGVLGVALLQTILAGLGFLVAGVPAAGLLTLAVLVLCVVQIGPGLPMAAAAIYLFNYSDTTTAVAFTVWAVLVTPTDNILRPLLLGRGASVPMLVIFIGAIGGLLEVGLIGMFLGAVMFALGYQLFRSWIGLTSVEAAAAEVAQSPAARA
jgi:predicted PurR-regulated permease PerM